LPALLFRRRHVADAAERQCIPGNTESCHNALAHGGGLRRWPASDRVRDVHFDGRELHLRDGRYECRIARAERRRVEDRRIEALVVRSVEPVDNLAFDVRVKDLDLDAELLGIAANALVVFG
jgi:hypothetical protein